jgi:hypothetical protein
MVEEFVTDGTPKPGYLGGWFHTDDALALQSWVEDQEADDAERETAEDDTAGGAR